VNRNVTCLVGAQFGSEGKGLIAGHIAKDFAAHVRVGAANAGHTVYGVDDRKHVMQQIPCAAYANPWASLYIGPGAQITPEIFERELQELFLWRYERGYGALDLIVDRRAHVITDEHVEREQQSDLAARIGSTSTIAKEGIGAAQAARVMREEGCMLAEEYYGVDAANGRFEVGDVPRRLAADNVHGRKVLLEGTQGTGLSLTTGFFPYVTSRNTTAAGLCADSGVPPAMVEDTILVARTFPIRVAGNSGPFWPDSEEVTWESLGVDSEKERTTVTKLVRRVATFSHDQLAEAVRLNGATKLALTFCDYLGVPFESDQLTESDLADYPALDALVQDVEENHPGLLCYFGTGPSTVADW
jgi:adenylosuccinate synthase